MTDLDNFYKVDAVDDVMAADINRLTASSSYSLFRNVETITDTKALVDNDTPIQVLTPSGADRDVTLPEEDTTNHQFIIINPTGTSYSLVLKTFGGTTLATITAGNFTVAYSSGDEYQINSVLPSDPTFDSVSFTGGGSLEWNSTYNTLDLAQTGTTLQLGQETHIYIKNTSAAIITDGSAVMFTGAVGASGVMTGALAVNDGTYHPMYFMGIATQEIAINGFGKITFIGNINGLDTSSWSDGDILYCDPDTAGALTSDKPGNGFWQFPVASVVNSNAGNGILFVRAIPNPVDWLKPRITSEASSATPTPNADTTDQYILTALATNPTFAVPAGTPTQGQKLIIRIKDNGTGRTVAWNAIYRAIGVTLPTSTTANKTVYIGCVYNSTDTKWDVVAVSKEA